MLALSRFTNRTGDLLVMSIPKLQQSQLLSRAGAPAHAALHCWCSLMCSQIRGREALINPARLHTLGHRARKSWCLSAYCQSILRVAEIQNGEKNPRHRGPDGHWCLEYFCSLPLPRALFSMDGVFGVH